jgi:hypothetical protein
MPLASCSFPASTVVIPAAPVETASKDQPLTSPSVRPELRVGGEPCGDPGYNPGPNRFQRDGVLHHTCTLCYLYSQQSYLYI